MPTSYSEAADLSKTGKTRLEEIRAALNKSDLESARSALLAARELPGFENDLDLLDLTYQLAARIGRRKGFTGAKPFLTIKDHINYVDQLAVTNDGKYLIANGGEFVVWNLPENRYAHSIPGAPLCRQSPATHCHHTRQQVCCRNEGRNHESGG